MSASHNVIKTRRASKPKAAATTKAATEDVHHLQARVAELEAALRATETPKGEGSSVAPKSGATSTASLGSAASPDPPAQPNPFLSSVRNDSAPAASPCHDRTIPISSVSVAEVVAQSPSHLSGMTGSTAPTNGQIPTLSASATQINAHQSKPSGFSLPLTGFPTTSVQVKQEKQEEEEVKKYAALAAVQYPQASKATKQNHNNNNNNNIKSEKNNSYDTIDHLLNPQGASKQCHCKKSRCLKLYCECFAANVFCKDCKCTNCHNVPEHNAVRLKAIKYKLTRRPRAFEPKFTPTAATEVPLAVEDEKMMHSRGCQCKKSGCNKRYCECFQNGVACTSSCKCTTCKNDGSLQNKDSVQFKDGFYEWRVPPTAEAVEAMATKRVRPSFPADFVPGEEPTFTFLTPAIKIKLEAEAEAKAEAERMAAMAATKKRSGNDNTTARKSKRAKRKKNTTSDDTGYPHSGSISPDVTPPLTPADICSWSTSLSDSDIESDVLELDVDKDPAFAECHLEASHLPIGARGRSSSLISDEFSIENHGMVLETKELLDDMGELHWEEAVPPPVPPVASKLSRSKRKPRAQKKRQRMQVPRDMGTCDTPGDTAEIMIDDFDINALASDSRVLLSKTDEKEDLSTATLCATAEEDWLDLTCY